MFIEFHLLQNFAPSCLNRDDTNTPKDCTFGGHRRVRISSQCIKRAVRKHFAEAKLLAGENLAERSKRLIGEVAKLLVEKGKPANEATALVKAALAAVKLSADDDNETQYLLFLGRGEIQGLADVVHEHWDALSPLLVPTETPAAENDKKARKTAKQKKAEAREAIPTDVAKKIKAVLNGGKAADLALFGRMLADQADLNIDAACQVAHGLSTNKVSMEMDFYTAVDDLREREADPGAGMMGTVEFNSSCFYRYANIDFDQLTHNLQDDTELARQTVRAFLEGSVHAIPTGKQNSMAAHNPPALVMAVVRDRGLWSLANAFESPVRPNHDGSLVHNSVRELDRYWGQLTKMYGNGGVKLIRLAVAEDEPDLASLKSDRVASISELTDAILNALPAGRGGMSVLLLRLAGPMQSWGTQSRFSVRDTGLEPSKSGVIGLLCAALGRPRSQSVADLTSLRMGVRVEREGQLARDFHTAQDVRRADGSGLADTVISPRYFLADAEFVVGFEGDRPLLLQLDSALRQPVWPLSLGRKSFVPGLPVSWVPVDDAVRDGELVAVLQTVPWIRRRPHEKNPKHLRCVVDVPYGSGEPRQDLPVSFSDRTFSVRHVLTLPPIQPPTILDEETLHVLEQTEG